MHLPKHVVDSIDVDVMRSFNQMQVLTHQNLSNILKGYAMCNPQLNYCQGMNFMAGYLFLTLDHKEEMAFGVMRELIERFQLANLFNKDLPMLKLMFY
jgi:hypothetical protein